MPTDVRAVIGIGDSSIGIVAMVEFLNIYKFKKGIDISIMVMD